MTTQKTETLIPVELVKRHLRARFNPLRTLTPESLSRQLDEFRSGVFTQAAQTFDIIEERDDILQSVAPKRKKAVARHGWEILTIDNTPEAQSQVEALEWFYNHLTATNALDENESGGVNLLIRQMMDAVGKRYAVHEIVWEPDAAGKLAATFRFVPLWFFENRTGRLRFLETVGSYEGVELEEGGWMVTVADGLMVACSIAWMYKHLPLRDWLIYSERHGMPILKGKTDAAPGSPEWEQLEAAVGKVGAEFGAVMNRSADIEVLDTTVRGQLPYPPLIERMDRAMAALWRGADLGTISKGEGLGASLQEDETEILEEDDAILIGETLNTQVDRFVIRYLFGDGVEPLAYIKIKTGQSIDEAAELNKWEKAVGLGVPLTQKDFYEQFSLPIPEDGDDLLTRPTGQSTMAPFDPPEAANVLHDPEAEVFKASALRNLGRAQAQVLQPFFDELTRALDTGDDGEFLAALARLQSALPEHLKAALGTDALTVEMENIYGSALVDGAVEGREETSAANQVAPASSNGAPRSSKIGPVRASTTKRV